MARTVRATTRAGARASAPRPSVVSLFSGAGGLDHGFEAAGFEVRCALEMDRDACATLRGNGIKGVLETALEDCESSAILEEARLKVGQTGVLIGGPPCQPFSKSGYWSRGDSLRLEDPRAR